MKCPECEKENKKSFVYIGYATSTCMCINQFYDEEGKHHYHNPNITTQHYTCSNEHAWTENINSHCWCGENWTGVIVKVKDSDTNRLTTGNASVNSLGKIV